MSRRRFLGTAAAVGLGGVVHAATPAIPDSNVDVISEDYIEVYPTGNKNTDVPNIQWSIEYVAPGGTVKLLAAKKDGISLHHFNFGTDKSSATSVEVTKNVNIVGEVLSRRIAELPSGTAKIGVEQGTTIIGGKDTVTCNTKANLKIQDIRFENGWDTAIRVIKSSGLTVSGCSIVDRKQSSTGGIYEATAAYGIYLGEDYDTWPSADPDEFSGNLLIENNYVSINWFSPKPWNPDDPWAGLYDSGALQTYNISSVMTIRNNEFRDGDANMVAFYGMQNHPHVFENNVIDTGDTNFGANALIPIGSIAGIGDINAHMTIRWNTVIQRGKGNADTFFVYRTNGNIIENNTVACERSDGQPVTWGGLGFATSDKNVVRNNMITGKMNDGALAVWDGSYNSFTNNDVNGVAPGFPHLQLMGSNNTADFTLANVGGNCGNLICYNYSCIPATNKIRCNGKKQSCGC